MLQSPLLLQKKFQFAVYGEKIHPEYETSNSEELPNNLHHVGIYNCAEMCRPTGAFVIRFHQRNSRHDEDLTSILSLSNTSPSPLSRHGGF